MQTLSEQDDWELLQAYARNGSEAAFEAIVQRYLNSVYGMALRQTNNTHLAQDVTQAVFLVLVRKARSIPPGTILPGWLFNTTRFVAQTVLRTERRRLERETHAMNDMMMAGSDSGASWEQLSPHLDDALGSLRERDRDILLLRFFQHQSVRDVSKTTGLSEDAVQKRTTRAVEKMRHYFAVRGIGVSAVALLAAVTANAAQAAPSTLMPAVIALSGAPGAAGASVLAAAQGAAQMLAISKMILPTGLTGAALLVLLPIAGTLLLSEPAKPHVFDLSRDFSLSGNPNGPWSYGAKQTLDGPLSLSRFSEITALDEEAWAFRRGTWPVIYRNGTTNTIYSSGGRFPAGAVWYAAGEDGTQRHFGAIRFTAPEKASGRYRLETAVESGLDGPAAGDADFHVVHKGEELFSRTVTSNSSRAGYTNEFALAPGDTIDFLVGRGADGRQRASILRIQATLTSLSPTNAP